MVTAIPVSNKISLVNGKERYTNSSVSAAAGNDDILSFALALNLLQYNAPAEKIVKSVKYELRNE